MKFLSRVSYSLKVNMKLINFLTIILLVLVGIVLCDINVCKKYPATPIKYITDPENCQRYWICNYGVGTLMQCPTNLCFDSKIEDCTYPSNRSNYDEKCPHQGTEYLRDVDNCTKYWQCSNGQKIHMMCPSELWFNFEKNECDYIRNYPDRKGCGDRRCPAGSTEKYPVPEDCTKYILCQGGYAFVMSCCYNEESNDCYFNPDTEQCVVKEKCNCVQTCRKNEIVFLDERNCSIAYRCENSRNLRCNHGCFDEETFQCSGVIEEMPNLLEEKWN